MDDYALLTITMSAVSIVMIIASFFTFRSIPATVMENTVNSHLNIPPMPIPNNSGYNYLASVPQ